MYSLFEKYIRFIEQLNEFIGTQVARLNIVLVLLICTDVLLRYAFKSTTTAVIELEWHLFALVFLMGMAYSLKHDRHVRVDVFYHKFREKHRAWINFIGGIFFLLPFCGVLIYTSYDFVVDSYNFGEGSPDPGGLPARYFIKAAIPLGFFFLLLQSLALIMSSFLVIIGRRKEIFISKEKGEQSHA